MVAVIAALVLTARIMAGNTPQRIFFAVENEAAARISFKGTAAKAG